MVRWLRHTSTPPCVFSPACDLEADQEGARRSIVPVLSSLSEHVKRKSSGSEEEEEEGCGGDNREVDPGWSLKNGSAALPFYLHVVILVEFSCSSLVVTLTEAGGRASWLNCFSAFSLSSRKNKAVARKNMPPRTMMKGQSMRA